MIATDAIRDYARECFAGSDAIANFDAAMANFQRDPTQAAAVMAARDEACRTLGRLQSAIIALADEVLSGEPMTGNVVPLLPTARVR